MKQENVYILASNSLDNHGKSRYLVQVEKLQQMVQNSQYIDQVQSVIFEGKQLKSQLIELIKIAKQEKGRQQEKGNQQGKGGQQEKGRQNEGLGAHSQLSQLSKAKQVKSVHHMQTDNGSVYTQNLQLSTQNKHALQAGRQSQNISRSFLEETQLNQIIVKLQQVQLKAAAKYHTINKKVLLNLIRIDFSTTNKIYQNILINTFILLRFIWWIPSLYLLYHPTPHLHSNLTPSQIQIYQSWLQINSYYHQTDALFILFTFLKSQTSSNQYPNSKCPFQIIYNIVNFLQVQIMSICKGYGIGLFLKLFDSSNATPFMLLYFSFQSTVLLLFTLGFIFSGWINYIRHDLKGPSPYPTQNLLVQGVHYFYDVVTLRKNPNLGNPFYKGNGLDNGKIKLSLRQNQVEKRMILQTSFNRMALIVGIKLLFWMGIPAISMIIFVKDKWQRLDEGLILSLTWKGWMTMDILICLAFVYWGLKFVFMIVRERAYFSVIYYRVKKYMIINIVWFERNQRMKRILVGLLGGQMVSGVLGMILLVLLLRLENSWGMTVSFYFFYLMINLLMDLYVIQAWKQGKIIKKKLIQDNLMELNKGKNQLLNKSKNKKKETKQDLKQNKKQYGNNQNQKNVKKEDSALKRSKREMKKQELKTNLLKEKPLTIKHMEAERKQIQMEEQQILVREEQQFLIREEQQFLVQEQHQYEVEQEQLYEVEQEGQLLERGNI